MVRLFAVSRCDGPEIGAVVFGFLLFYERKQEFGKS